MQEWSDSVRIAIDVILACVIITALLTVNYIGNSLGRLMDNQQAAAADVQEYRLRAAYEGTDLYSQDIVNLVLTSQGSNYVTVDYKPLSSSSPDLHWGVGSTNSTEFSSIAVGNVVRNDKVYRCTLDFSPTGEFRGYQFQEVGP